VSVQFPHFAIVILGGLLVLAAAALLAGCGDEPEGTLDAQPSETGASDKPQAPAPEVLRQRIRALARQGTAARHEVEPYLKHPSPAAREEAALAYPRVTEEERSAPELAQLSTTDPEPDVRAAAVTALGHMRAMDDMDAILEALEDPDPLVRRRAAEAATRITGQRYDVNVPPEQWRRTVEYIRTLWQKHGDMLRSYHERRHPSTRR